MDGMFHVSPVPSLIFNLRSCISIILSILSVYCPPTAGHPPVEHGHDARPPAAPGLHLRRASCRPAAAPQLQLLAPRHAAAGQLRRGRGRGEPVAGLGCLEIYADRCPGDIYTCYLLVIYLLLQSLVSSQLSLVTSLFILIM